MKLSFGGTTRGAAWTLLSTLGAVGCQEPGADWVPDDGAETSSTSTSTNTQGNGSPVTSATNTSTATSDGGTSDGGSSDGTTTSSTGAGGGGSTASSETTGGGATTSSETTETTTSDGTSTTGGGGGSGSSLITNGDFSAGEADWSFAGSGSVDTDSGQYCVTLSADGEVSVGWPNGGDAAVLAPGTNYQLSYQAYFTGSAAPTLITKVGQAFDPYEPFVEENAALGSSPMTFTHTLSVDTEQQAGVLFRIQGTTGDVVCFDDVVLRAQ